MASLMHLMPRREAGRWLICLELQAIHAGHREVLENSRLLLAHARRQGWPVVHVHLRPLYGPVGGPAVRAAAGCEPLPSEPVFFRDGAPPMPDHPFWRLASEHEGSDALLCGVVSDTWAVRSVETAARMGIQLNLVREALGGMLPAHFAEDFGYTGLRGAMSALPPWPLEAANAP
jgi:hypothetical protein